MSKRVRLGIMQFFVWFVVWVGVDFLFNLTGGDEMNWVRTLVSAAAGALAFVIIMAIINRRKTARQTTDTTKNERTDF